MGQHWCSRPRGVDLPAGSRPSMPYHPSELPLEQLWRLFFCVLTELWVRGGWWHAPTGTADLRGEEGTEPHHAGIEIREEGRDE